MKTQVLKHLLFVVLFSLITVVSVANTVKDNGKRVQKEFKVDKFDVIHAGGVYHIKYTKADKYKVVVTFAENLMDRLIIEAQDGTLSLSNKSFTVCSELLVEIQSPHLRALELNGAASFEADQSTYIREDEVEFELNGSSKAECAIRAEKLSIDLNGASQADIKTSVVKAYIETNGAASLDITGGAKFVEINSNGASRVRGKNFKTIEADLEVNGAAGIRLKRPDKVNMEERGAGDIDLY
ncbi:MAG: GIN domain-containing protein [Bacteroidales bacterium]